MKTPLLPSLLALFLAGCVFEAPLTEKHTIPINPAVLGLWEEIPEKSGETPDRMVVAKLSDTEYLVNYPVGKDGMYFRAWPVRVGKVDCVQLQLLGYANAALKAGEPRFLVVSYALSGASLETKTLNTDLVSKTLKTSGELKKAFLAHEKAPDLFSNPGRFKRLPFKN